MNYPEPVALTRRSALALLAVSGLAGCSFEPITWETTTANPTADASTDPAAEVRADYFAQSPDSGARTLLEGVPAAQRISTPHFDARLDRRFVGEEIGAETAAQLRERTPIRASKDHELVAITLQAGVPSFADSEAGGASISIELGDGVKLPVQQPFGALDRERGRYVRDWALLVFSVPTGAPVRLAVADEGKTVRVDLREGAPIVDQAWEANRGFRERVDIEVVDPAAVLHREVQTAPVNGQVQKSRFRLGLNPDAARGLVPWNPQSGWAPDGRQWLRVAMRAKVEFAPADPAVFATLDVKRSFSYVEGRDAPLAPNLPETIETEVLQRGTAELDVTWAVNGAASEAQLICNPVASAMYARYTDHPDVAATFVGRPEQAMFTLRITPRGD